jgi:hypothetical protein
MKLEKDWLTWVIAAIPAVITYGFNILFHSQNSYLFLFGILLLYVVIGRVHIRFKKLQERVEELEAKILQITDQPVKTISGHSINQHLGR